MKDNVRGLEKYIWDTIRPQFSGIGQSCCSNVRCQEQKRATLTIHWKTPQASLGDLKTS